MPERDRNLVYLVDDITGVIESGDVGALLRIHDEIADLVAYLLTLKDLKK